jgi:hypothetical protein
MVLLTPVCLTNSETDRRGCLASQSEAQQDLRDIVEEVAAPRNVESRREGADRRNGDDLDERVIRVGLFICTHTFCGWLLRLGRYDARAFRGTFARSRSAAPNSSGFRCV